MRCKYCKEEITLSNGRWTDDGDCGPSICIQAPKNQVHHAPEDSATTIADQIEAKLAEVNVTLAEIERLTAKLKEER